MEYHPVASIELNSHTNENLMMVLHYQVRYNKIEVLS